ncbi:hypothetical protein ACQUXI_003917 [Cronobacter turicensis]|nr:hypothetical protein [Klebsiella pneumoniae]
MTANTVFYIVLAAFAVSAFVLPRHALKEQQTELVNFQFLCTSAVGFISACVLAGGSEAGHGAFSFIHAVTTFSLICSADTGFLLWRHRAPRKVLTH